MSILDNIKNLFQKNIPTETTTSGDVFIEDIDQTNLSPFGVNITSITEQYQNVKEKAKYQFFLEQREMSNNPFIVSIVETIIMRAFGTNNEDLPLFQLSLDDKIEVSDKVRKDTNIELAYIVELVEKTLLEVTTDSNIFCDGYVHIIKEQGKGVTDILSNLSTKAYSINALITNKGKTVAYETAINQSLQAKGVSKNERVFVNTDSVGRINAKTSGNKETFAEDLINIDHRNSFLDKEYIVNDLVYGGICEKVYPSYVDFMNSMGALVSSRIDSSVIERYIMQELKDSSEKEREKLESAFMNTMKSVDKKIKDKRKNRNYGWARFLHFIPTINGANSINIQESTPNTDGLKNVEDIMIHIKKLMADIGFNYELTAYAQSEQGGNEQGGSNRNSIQMDTHGYKIRLAVKEYVLHIVAVHFKYKFGQDINLKHIKLVFPSVINQQKLNEAEILLQSVSNSSQIDALIKQVKEGVYGEPTEVLVKYLFQDVIPPSDKRDEIMEAIITVCKVAPPQEPQGE